MMKPLCRVDTCAPPTVTPFESGVLDQLAREVSLRPLKRAACGRVLHRPLAVALLVQPRIVSAIAAGSPCASRSDANSAI